MLNWKIPASDEQIKEIQAIGWLWRCSQCGASERSAKKREICSACHSPLPPHNVVRMLTPAGFAVRLGSDPHSNLVTKFGPPHEPPFLTAGDAAWSPLITPKLGRHRSTFRGTINHMSSGVSGHGYAVCLDCGFAASEVDKNFKTMPRVLENHFPLRGGKRRIDNQGICVGNKRSFAIQRGLRLGGQEITDIYQLQLNHPGEGRPLNKIEATTVAVALRNALCAVLGIEQVEIGYTAQEDRFQSKVSGYSIYLYDTAAGGAGYASQAAGMLPTLIRDARNVLECSDLGCGDACHGCLLTFDTRFDVANLDRHKGLEVLTDGLLESFDLSPKSRFFGEASAFEMRRPTEAVLGEMDGATLKKLRVYATTNPEDWDWWSWPLRTRVELLLGRDASALEIVLPEGALEHIDPTVRHILANLAKRGVRFISAPRSSLMAGDGMMLIEMSHDADVTSWASGGSIAQTLGASWGNIVKDGDHIFVSAKVDAFRELSGDTLGKDELEPKLDENAIMVEFGTFHCDISHVGTRFWNILKSGDSRLAKRMDSGETIQSVRYEDRYIRSPIIMGIIYKVLETLLSDHAKGPNTNLHVITSMRSQSDYRNPTFIYHNWTNARVHEQVLEYVFRPLCDQVSTETKQQSSLSHGRELTIKWSSGATSVIRLDQGLGFLRSQQTKHFDFRASSVEQAEEIRDLQVHVNVHESESFAVLQTT